MEYMPVVSFSTATTLLSAVIAGFITWAYYLWELENKDN